MLVFKEARYQGVLSYNMNDFEAVVENLKTGECVGLRLASETDDYRCP